jgi:hypothetical protein
MHSTLYSQLFVFLHITIETWGAGSWNLFERVIIFNPFLVIQGPYGCITTHKTLYDHLIPLSIYLSSWSSITFPLSYQFYYNNPVAATWTHSNFLLLLTEMPSLQTPLWLASLLPWSLCSQRLTYLLAHPSRWTPFVFL